MAKAKKPRPEAGANAEAQLPTQNPGTQEDEEGSEEGVESDADAQPDGAAEARNEADEAAAAAPAERVEPEAPARDRYRTTHSKLSAEISRLAREAFRAKDFAAHGELHQVEMAIAHLRHTMTVAKGRLTGDPRELLKQLLTSL